MVMRSTGPNFFDLETGESLSSSNGAHRRRGEV